MQHLQQNQEIISYSGIVLVIDCIEGILKIPFLIYNCCGNFVLKIEGYNNISNVFLGAADQLTGLGANKLPEDTYFYHIEIPVEVTRIDKLTGYLVLNRYYAPIKKYTRPFLNTLLLI